MNNLLLLFCFFYMIQIDIDYGLYFSRVNLICSPSELFDFVHSNAVQNRTTQNAIHFDQNVYFQLYIRFDKNCTTASVFKAILFKIIRLLSIIYNYRIFGYLVVFINRIHTKFSELR